MLNRVAAFRLGQVWGKSDYQSQRMRSAVLFGNSLIWRRQLDERPDINRIEVFSRGSNARPTANAVKLLISREKPATKQRCDCSQKE
jgi:hypothetical protein